jgi:CheY-like chemotaxis protein
MARLSQPILVVEDSTATRAALASLLNFADYTTLTVRSAEEALDFLRRGGRTCLIILDLGLPGMNGATFRMTLLADRALASIPVLVYSAQDASAVPRLVAYVNKTADPDELLSAVARVCAKSPVAGRTSH